MSGGIGTGPSSSTCSGTGPGRVGDDELDLDRSADHPGQGLADQRPVAVVEPVAREPVRCGDAEQVVVDLDELGVLQPGLEVGRRKGRPAARRGRRATPASHPFNRRLRDRKQGGWADWSDPGRNRTKNLVLLRAGGRAHGGGWLGGARSDVSVRHARLGPATIHWSGADRIAASSETAPTANVAPRGWRRRQPFVCSRARTAIAEQRKRHDR